MSKFLLAAGLIASVYGSPLQERGVSCQAVNGIINIMRAQSVVTPFCSSVLAISTVTQTSSVTSTPPCKTITTSVPTTDVITSYSTSTVYGTTTVYPVGAVSVTSTCALGATVVPETPSKNKRGFPLPPPAKPQVWANPPKGWEPTPIGISTCLTGFQGPSITSACSCLSISTPSTLSLVTVTLPQQTVTKVIPAPPVDKTTTSTTTTTSFTSTYSATQYYTSTFTILPSPSAISNFPDGSSFGSYPNLDFPGMDIINFFCYANGPAPPSPYPACASYADCVAECVFYNDNSLGGSAMKCGTVTYNSPSDVSSGSCYLKTGQVGCGSANPMTNSSVILPLVPNDVQ